jgi:hypothetical protein
MFAIPSGLLHAHNQVKLSTNEQTKNKSLILLTLFELLENWRVGRICHDFTPNFECDFLSLAMCYE